MCGVVYQTYKLFIIFYDFVTFKAQGDVNCSENEAFFDIIVALHISMVFVITFHYIKNMSRKIFYLFIQKPMKQRRINRRGKLRKTLKPS